jgi:hypothetical protein
MKKFCQVVKNYFELIGMKDHHRNYSVTIDEPQDDDSIPEVGIFDTHYQKNVNMISLIPERFNNNPELVVDKVLECIYNYEKEIK